MYQPTNLPLFQKEECYQYKDYESKRTGRKSRSEKTSTRFRKQQAISAGDDQKPFDENVPAAYVPANIKYRNVRPRSGDD